MDTHVTLREGTEPISSVDTVDLFIGMKIISGAIIDGAGPMVVDWNRRKLRNEKLRNLYFSPN
jgi:hypothetical protein